MNLSSEPIRPDLRPCHSGDYEVGVAGGCRQVPLEATHLAFLRSEVGWLRFDVRLPDERASNQEWLLVLNRALAGGAKFCLSPRGEPTLRLDVPLRSEDDDGEDRIPQALSCLQQALHALRAVGESAPAPPTGELLSQEPVGVKPLCTGAGWPCLERAPGHWMVEMEGTPAYCQAEITVQGGDLLLCVVLAEWEEMPAPCAEAITHLLLTACDIFRMARAAIETQGPKHRALLLARLPVADLETDFLHALSALNVGARRMLQEVGALQRPEVAASYLSMTATAMTSSAMTSSAMTSSATTSSRLEEKRRNDDE